MCWVQWRLFDITKSQNTFQSSASRKIISNKRLNFFEFLYFSTSKLLDTPHGINPLLSDEKERLLAEYVTLHMNAMRVIGDLKHENSEFTLEQVWYALLTEEMYYKNCKFINFISLKYLNRSHNECIVESAVSNVEEIDRRDRPLKDENVEKLDFLATNGPHPLVSMDCASI